MAIKQYIHFAKVWQAPTYDTEMSLLDFYPKIDEHVCPEGTCVKSYPRKWINPLWYIHTKEQYSAIKRN